MTTILIFALAFAAQPAPEFAGTVSDIEGRPVAGASVIHVHPSDAALDIAVLSDSSGRFRFAVPDAHASARQLLVWKAGFAAWAFRPNLEQRSWTIRIGEEQTDKLQVVLVPAPAVSIQLRAPDGKPVPGARVTPRYLGRDDQFVFRETGLSEQLSVSSDETGCVRLPGRGGYIVDSTAYGRQSFLLKSDGVLPQTVVLAPVGELRGRLVGPGSDRLEGWTIALTSVPMRDRGTEPPTDSTSIIPVGIGTAVSASDGTFVVTRLAVGTYRVLATHGRIKEFDAGGSQTVSIRQAAAASVDVQLTPTRRAFGRVLERGSDKPIPSVVLQCGGERVITDENGRFEGFVSSAPSYISIFSAPAGYVMPLSFGRQLPASETPGAAFDVGTLTLKKTEVLRGVVRDESGGAVHGVTVTSSWIQHDESGEGYGWRNEHAVSDDRGEFHLARSPNDVALTVSALGQGLALESAVRVAEGDRHPLNLTVSDRFTTKLVARVTDTEGRPIPTAVARFEQMLETIDGQPFGGRRVQFARKDSIAADADGTIRTPLPVARSGKYSVQISADGFLPHATPFVPPQGSDRESLLGTFALERARSASGLVVDSSGKPVPGVTVSGQGVPESPQADQPIVRVRTDATGRFRLLPLHTGTAVLTVRADGYRPGGAIIPDSAQEMRITIYRADEAIAELDRIQVPGSSDARKDAGITLMNNILPHVRNSNYFHGEALKLLSRVAPGQLVGELAQTTNATSRVETLVLLGEFDEANAQAEQIENGYSRAYARFGIFDACRAEQPRRQILAAALIDARTIQEPDRRAVVLSGVADRLVASGRHEEAKALLAESLGQIRPLADKDWAGFAKGHYAERLARFDFKSAVSLLDAMDPKDKARHAGNIAHALAAIEPEKAEQIVAASDATNHVVAFRIRVCYRMATVDLDRAERIRQGTPRNYSYSKEHALGVMAMAIRQRQPDRARELLRQAWSELEASEAQGAMQSGLYRFGVALAMVSYAEEIDPENLTDYFWRAIALHPVSRDNFGQPEERPIQELERQALLALAFGLYEREPAMCRRIMEPAFTYWSNPDHLQGQSFYRKTATFVAMALSDPARAAAWAIHAHNTMPAKNRSLIPQPWLTVLSTLCADRQAIQDLLGDQVFTRWVIDQYD